MKLLKNKQRVQANMQSDKAARWIAGGITRIQKRWAEVMEKRFAKLNPFCRKAVLITGCLFMVTYCTVLIAYSFNKAGHILMRPTSIVLPITIGKALPVVPSGMPVFIKRIEKFKQYLDSLSKTGDGRRVRDSLLLRRPGLLDSIRKIERIYCNK